jgi:hypothetical protein
MECLVQGAERDFAGYTPSRHGLGVVRYDPTGAIQTLNSWITGKTDRARRAFIEQNQEELLSGVSRRAHEIYEQEGRPGGRELVHWRRAKTEHGLPEDSLL